MKVTRIEEAYGQCGVKQEVIIQFIQQEWIRPLHAESNELDEEDLARIRLIHELKEEFGVNDDSVPIILSLLDQLNRMHLELEKLHHNTN